VVYIAFDIYLSIYMLESSKLFKSFGNKLFTCVKSFDENQDFHNQR